MTRQAARGTLGCVEGAALDGLVTRLLAMSPFDYRVAADDSERALAYRLRGRTVLDRGWARPEDLPDRQEHDEYDSSAVQVIG